MLRGEEQGDLLELCLTLGACMMVEAGAEWSMEEAKLALLRVIEDGSALRKLAEMVTAQGGDASAVYDTSLLPQAAVTLEVPSEKNGYVSRIHTERVGLISMHLGGGRATKESSIDLSVGVVLHKKVGDAVRAGESLATIHASGMEKAKEAAQMLLGCYEFSDAPVARPVLIKQILR